MQGERKGGEQRARNRERRGETRERDKRNIEFSPEHIMSEMDGGGHKLQVICVMSWRI